MRTAIATVSLSGSLTEKLTAASTAGFDGVEIFENDLLASPLSPEEVRQRCADLGLRVDLYQPVRDIEAVPPAQFARNLRRARHKFRTTQRLGADTVLVSSSLDGRAVDDDTLAADQLRQLAQSAAEFGLKVAYEALAWGRHVNTYEHAWRLVRDADHPTLGVCLDSFNILARGSDPAGIEEIPAEKLFFLQLADAPLMATDVLQWSRHYRCFPGQGGFDLARLLRHVLAAGYRGPLSLEIFNDVFRQADPGPTAVDAHRSLIALQESVGLAELPAPPPPTGFAFVELATPDTEAPSSLLTALGFARTGTHRTKPVALWERGDARILLNTGAGSRRKGTVLGALGLETEEPAELAARAEALLAPVLPRRSDGEDAPPAALAAPDGTELLLCATDRPERPHWRRDFDRTGQPVPAAPDVHIDHVALMQPRHRFDEAALFHRSVLRLAQQGSAEVADPEGLLYGRALTSGDGGVRIVLTIGPAPSDEAPRVQHVALATDDVLAAARAFREAGGRLLAIPDNYYDDLAARFELPEQTLAEYRELGILYDEDAHGTFRHCCTATTGRLFFELTERRNGYRGYGATDAPVRLAAQRAAESRL
ncbi:sugar phosphate isomerase/epimerase and 4-hydroxyphenylpyruvate domain-containing protein [Streptomyces sulphureus]|uniref:sugar phosphate isomerase/epimerase and 4-hydroxyphenylpyruvate domain-containing protein n=1 Tax=Streptomyces sulphureus TaxID=47758 RepID=UPI00037D09DA|nr:sugar phosphate isomerase/epimerase and 4-hydroxyphenylpyruvate domain-containing protein [Streptomyces sulphureus]